MTSKADRDGVAATSGSGSEDAGQTAGPANWLLVEGDRLVVAGAVLAVVLVALLAVAWPFGFVSVRAASPMYFLFSSLVTGNLTLVTVVLSINQLVLSRELGSPGSLRERIQGAVEFRSDVEEATGTDVAPETPRRFLRYLHERVESRTHRLEAAAADVAAPELARRLDALADSLYEDVDRVNSSLASEDGIFSVVAATIATNHGDQLHEIAAIRDEYADSLSEEVGDALDAIGTHLLHIDVARNYFKTVYVQKELAYLSRVLLYVGVPAIVADALALVFYNAVGPESPPALVVYAVVVVAFTAGFAPLAVLFAFVLRLAWIAQRTATVAPFSTGRYR